MLGLPRKAVGSASGSRALCRPLLIRRARWPPSRPLSSQPVPPPSPSHDPAADTAWLLPVLKRVQDAASDSSNAPLLLGSAPELLPRPQPKPIQRPGVPAKWAGNAGNWMPEYYHGTTYELCVAAALARLGFNLRRVGGRGDGGIDLMGTLELPPPVPVFPDGPLRVIVQCKGVQISRWGTPKKGPSGHVKPMVARELQGAFSSLPLSWRTEGSGVIGFVASIAPASAGVREAIARSLWPLGFIQVTTRGIVAQMMWNARVEHLGLDHLGVTRSYSGSRVEEDELGITGDKIERVALTWHGINLRSDDKRGGPTGQIAGPPAHAQTGGEEDGAPRGREEQGESRRGGQGPKRGGYGNQSSNSDGGAPPKAAPNRGFGNGSSRGGDRSSIGSGRASR